MATTPLQCTGQSTYDPDLALPRLQRAALRDERAEERVPAA